jgi:isopentenyldiphosphate isomerase
VSVELSIIVDKHDQVIGYKPRDSRTYEDIFRISALWLVNSRGQVLIAQRSPAKSYGGGLWGPAAAGTVEHGESYEANIVKEATEEIGLTRLKFQKHQKVYQDNGERRYFIQWFTAILDREAVDFRLQPDEVAQVKWAEPVELFHDVRINPHLYVQSAPLWERLFANGIGFN